MIPRLHVVATDAVVSCDGFPALAAGLQEACGGELALHLRARELTSRRLFELAASLSARARQRGGWCAVNERVDVALAAGAQAVQLGRGALPVREARRLLRAGTAIGASVHDPAEALDAREAGANYLVVGTIYPSASHPGREASGPALLDRCRTAGLPMVAIGGIDRDRVEEVVRAGAVGVAVIRAVWSAADPVTAARQLLNVLLEA
ncbi:MAG: thiamine phosphate synthase [Gemmatimonadota bacterium]